MTYFDLLIIGEVALAGLLGYRDGFFRKIFGILSFLVGLIVATTYTGKVGRAIDYILPISMEFSYILAFFLLFLSIILLQNILYKILAKGRETLKFPSRMGGALLGAAQGTLVASLLLLMLGIFQIPSDSTKQESIFYKPVLNIAPRFFDYWSLVVPQSRDLYDMLKKDLHLYEIFD